MNTSPLLRCSGLFIATLAATLSARGDIIVDQNTTISGSRFVLNAGQSETYLVNDGITLAFTGTYTITTGRVFTTGTASLIIGPNPAGPLGSGKIEFRDISSSNANAGAISITDGTLNVSNARFINIRAISSGGAIVATSAATVLNHVEFVGNSAGNSGAIRILSGMLTGRDIRFDDNFGTGSAVGNGSGGAFGQSNAGAYARLGDAVFVNNRARWNGGAIWLSNGDIVLDNPVFTDNWTGLTGGAIFSAGRPFVINITASGTVTDYLYSGNRAGGLSAAAAIGEVEANAPTFTPSATAGGFLYSSGATTFDIDLGASLTVGVADAADKAEDSIAGTTGARLTKAGRGDLILNADNSGFIGTTTISAGRLLLGNAGAKLGGSITVGAGATFGGVGTVSSAIGTPQLTINSGATLQVGADPAAAQTLDISGTLIISAGATLDFDLFGGTNSDLLTATTLNVLGTGTLRLGTIASGTYTLTRWNAGTAFNAANWGAGIVADTQAGRNFTSELTLQSGTALQLITTIDNLALAWTGATGTLWNAAQENWSGAGGVTKFLGGDTVTFDQTGENRGITVATAGVSVKNMTVTGGENYAFDGGSITTSGTLMKTGAGTLTLANSANTFASVSLGGGSLAFSDAAQIGGKLGVLAFADSSTARVVIGDDVTFSGGGLDNRLLINGASIDGGLLVADGKTLIIEGASGAVSGVALYVINGNRFEILSPGGAGSSRVLFKNNSTSAGGGGAIHVNGGFFRADNAVFEGNQASSPTNDRVGGALDNRAATSLTVLNNAIFTNNRANSLGGAIYNGGSLALSLTRSGTTTYEGNAAFNRAMTTVNPAGGGFLYQTAGGVADIDIAAGSTLVIGGADTEKDTLAGEAGSRLGKSGSGALVLRADSSAHAGATTVNAGSLILRGANAKLGGTVTVRAGATTGGSGVFGGFLSLETGALLDIGEAGDTAAQILTVGGTLRTVGSTLNFSIFSNTTSDRLDVAVLDGASAGNTINLDQFVSGTYILGDGIAGLAGSSLTLRGNDISAGLRQNGELRVVDTTKLQLELTADASRALTWRGTASGTWASTGSNWTGVALPSGLFADADAVRFDDTAPGAAARSIGISAAGVTVAEMVVDTTSSYAFTGGGITANASYVNGSVLITGTTGKLIKDGAGTLVFQNAVNTFTGGIELNAGTIEFTSGAQLGAGSGAVLTLANATTIRPLASSSTLSTSLALVAGAVAIVEVGSGRALTYNGASSADDDAAVLVKTGAGALTFSGSAALGHGATRIDAGYVFLRDITPGDIATLAHTFDFNGGWLDLSDAVGPADGSTASDWAGLAFTGSNGGVIGANDRLTLGAGDTAFGIGSEIDGGKRGVFVVVDAGTSGTARLTGPNFYAGNTRVLSGVLAISADAQLGDTAVNREVILDGGALAAAPAFSSSRALEIRAAFGAVDVVGGAAVWAGVISGGKLVKTGDGELLLSGTNTHAETEIAGGTLAIGSFGALGAGVLRATSDDAVLRAAADGLQIANAIALDRALTLNPGGRAAIFTGVISGTAPLAVTGPGTVALAGANTFGRLAVGGGARLVAAHNHALGGNAAAVTVDGATLEIAAFNTLAKNVTVSNGTLVFANVAALPENAAMLRISAGGGFSLTNSSTLALTGAPLVSGRIYRLVHLFATDTGLSIDADTVFDPGAQNVSLAVAAPHIDPATGNLVISGVNQAIAPGRDVTALFDALAAATGAVNARLGESFLFDSDIRDVTAPASRLWLRGFGSFGDYDAEGAAISHRDTTYGALAGIEHIFADTLILGLYGGQTDTTIKTDNGAETDATQPLGGVYAALRAGVFHVAADFMMGAIDADTTRPEGAGVARGSYKADSLSGGVTLGFSLGLWDGGSAQPTVGARFTRLAYKDQRENETDPGAVLIDNFIVERWQGMAGVRVTQIFGNGAASLLLGRRFSLDKRRVTVHGTLLENGADFTDACDPADGDAFTAGLGLGVTLGKHTSLALRYDCEFGDTHTRHDASATLSFAW